MRVAVLGATGMLGRVVCRVLHAAGHHVTAWVNDQRDIASVALPLAHAVRLGNLSRRSQARIVASWGGEWIVNCAGVVKSRTDTLADVAVLVNAGLPHWLERDCAMTSTRIIHLSSDCVFSGTKGNYTEADDPDATDLYGASKAAGEITGPRSLTLRTSFVGCERGTQRGLLEWFLRQAREHAAVQGYTNHTWSGLSAMEVARVIGRIISSKWRISGVYHLAGRSITKCDLLLLLRERLGLDVEVMPAETPITINRTLDPSAFRGTMEYIAPPWSAMAEDLVDELEVSRA